MPNIDLSPAVSHYLKHQASLIYLLVDRDGTVLQTNPCTRALLGEQVNTMNVADLFLHLDGPAIAIETLRSRPDEAVLLSIATASGLPESYLFHFLPLADNTVVLGTADLSEHQRLQHELLDLNRQLGGLTRELQKKNHQLAELNQLKNRFLGMAAHDLRKPVSSVLAYSEFLLDETKGLLNTEHRGFLQTIHDSTALMRRIIDDFLDISLIEAGRFPLHRAPTDIQKPIERCLELQVLPAGKRGISLHFSPLSEETVISIDQYKIEQVLNNLVANAIEHSPDNSTVTIRLDRTGEGLRVTVTDSGPGLSHEEAKNLFSLYTTGKAGKAEKTAASRATGLGLAISKKIVTAHGGTIEVKSTPGPGASFCFTLPDPFDTAEKTP